MTTTQVLSVALGERSYPICIGTGLLSQGHALLPVIHAGQTVVIVTNETVGPLYLERAKGLFQNGTVVTHELADGEQWKTPAAALSIIDTALENGAARDSLFVALGGGVVGDITGFAAAAFMRGVSFLQIPTTLLAQVDSSVGGKTGVNHARGKNLIGAFHQPKAVLIDIDTLNTLQEREYAAGLAEVIKYGAIADPAFFEWLEANIGALRERETEALTHAIYRSCELKALIVAEDEREQGRRALLNFGHTFGHAIEACTNYNTWLHGEAVALGMIMAARMSALPQEDIERLVRLLDAAGLPTAAVDVSATDLLAAMLHDKKVAQGRVRLILLRSLGDAFVTGDYDDAHLQRVLEQ
ncbi:MAG: 3-dehydroquinate synthase [Pseudomonadota bacterium]